MKPEDASWVELKRYQASEEHLAFNVHQYKKLIRNDSIISNNQLHAEWTRIGWKKIVWSATPPTWVIMQKLKGIKGSSKDVFFRPKKESE